MWIDVGDDGHITFLSAKCIQNYFNRHKNEKRLETELSEPVPAAETGEAEVEQKADEMELDVTVSESGKVDVGEKVFVNMAMNGVEIVAQPPTLR